MVNADRLALTTHHEIYNLINRADTNRLNTEYASFVAGLDIHNAEEVAEHVSGRLNDAWSVVVDQGLMKSAANVLIEQFEIVSTDSNTLPAGVLAKEAYGITAGLLLLQQYATMISLKTGALEGFEVTDHLAENVDEVGAHCVL